jgi:hypothetical protein
MQMDKFFESWELQQNMRVWMHENASFLLLYP